MKRKSKWVPSEEDEQKAVAMYLDTLGVLWCHVPNGGARHKIVGAKLKGQGVKRGVPDIIIFTPPPFDLRKRGAVIELKNRNGGKVSTEQRAWLEELEKLGWLVAICKGADEAIKQIEAWGYGSGYD